MASDCRRRSRASSVPPKSMIDDRPAPGYYKICTVRFYAASNEFTLYLSLQNELVSEERGQGVGR